MTHITVLSFQKVYGLSMIQILQQGIYHLIETTKHIKILYLHHNGQKHIFAWINAKDIGEILVTSHKPHHVDHMLAIGKYRLYTVKDDPKLTDLYHLELLVGEGIWQGYLLPHGLPDDEKKRNRIIPSKEIITKSIN